MQKLTKTRKPNSGAELANEFKATAVLPYVKGLSEQLRRCLQQQGVRAVFKSETTLRSQLVRPKDAVDPAKQDGVVYRIPCECGKVYIGETGRPMQDRIKEHDRDIRLARTETSTVSEHAHNTGHKSLWNEVKFIDRDPYYYTRRVKEAIHIRLYPNNINRDSGIEILEAWMTTIKKKQQQESRATADRRGSRSLSEQQGHSMPLSYVMLRLTHPVIRGIPTINIYSFLNRLLPRRCRPNCQSSLLNHADLAVSSGKLARDF